MSRVWTEGQLPLSEFQPTRFGRPLEDTGQLEPTDQRTEGGFVFRPRWGGKQTRALLSLRTTGLLLAPHRPLHPALPLSIPV